MSVPDSPFRPRPQHQDVTDDDDFAADRSEVVIVGIQIPFSDMVFLLIQFVAAQAVVALVVLLALYFLGVV